MASTITTSQGDSWDGLAYRLWGEERLFDQLMRANPAHLDVVVFPAGVVLLVPDVETPTQTLELPPWMTA